MNFKQLLEAAKDARWQVIRRHLPSAVISDQEISWVLEQGLALAQSKETRILCAMIIAERGTRDCVYLQKMLHLAREDRCVHVRRHLAPLVRLLPT